MCRPMTASTIRQTALRDAACDDAAVGGESRMSPRKVAFFHTLEDRLTRTIVKCEKAMIETLHAPGREPISAACRTHDAHPAP